MFRGTLTIVFLALGIAVPSFAFRAQVFEAAEAPVAASHWRCHCTCRSADFEEVTNSYFNLCEKIPTSTDGKLYCDSPNITTRFSETEEGCSSVYPAGSECGGWRYEVVTSPEYQNGSWSCTADTEIPGPFLGESIEEVEATLKNSK